MVGAFVAVLLLTIFLYRRRQGLRLMVNDSGPWITQLKLFKDVDLGSL